VQVLAHLGLRRSPEYLYFESRELPSPLRAFYVGVLQVYVVTIVGLRSPLIHRLLVRLRLHPVQVLCVSFAILIALGTFLLALPGASRDGHSLPLVDALFTSTSAVCVTGLVVRDTGTQFGPLGAATLLGLIQAGGLGMLTITAAFAMFGGARLTRDEARLLRQVLEVETERQMRQTFARILVATAVIEGLGALLLWSAWSEIIPDPLTRAGAAVFHSVSAFCNAGFSLFAGHASLTGFASDPRTLGIVAALIVLGGLGFGTLTELWRAALSGIRRAPAALSRHARWASTSTAALLLAGAAAFYWLESRGALGHLDAPARWLGAVFQSVTLRTAGFNCVDLAGLGLPAAILCIAWMLVGGSPGSTAGGMKTTTAAAAAVGLLRPGWNDRPTFRRASWLALLFLASYGAIGCLLALAQGAWDRRIAFEAASALGTVGLSMGVTAELTLGGKLTLCLAMFAGRVGPLALVASLLPRLAEPAPVPARDRILLA
jgi:trk system potassium uptake protein TrkH